MLSTRNAAETNIADTSHDDAPLEEGRGWAPLAVAPLTIVLLGAALTANSAQDVAVATLSLMALLIASVAFAAART
jgi:hypothetical protein